MSAAQIQIILSSADSFAGLIAQTLAQDNATRRTAEDLYGQLKQQRPDACATNLLQLLRASSDARVRSTCAVFLRKFFKPARKEAGWEQLNRNTKVVVKRELLAALASETDRTAAKQTADAVVALGVVLLEGKDASKGWPELLSSLQSLLNPQAGASAKACEAALQVVSGSAERLQQASGQLAPSILGCLGAQLAVEVQVAAVKAVVEFLAVLKKPRDLRPYQAALPACLAALQNALAGGHLPAAETMLTELIRAVEVEPAMWQPHVAAAVPGMLTLAGAGPNGLPLPDDIRRLAAEFVMTLIDIKPQMVQGELGAGPLASQVISCVAQFLASGVEDDSDWATDLMASPDMDEDDSLGEMHRYGLECALRVASELDRAAVLRAVVDMTGAWARDASDWRRRHAVLMCLSQVVGSCKEVVGAPELSSLAGLLVESMRDPHCRVRWAACHAVGVLGDDLGPALQLQEGGGGAAVLKALTELLAEPDSLSCPQRVKAQACRAIVGFLGGLDKDEAELDADAAKEARQQRVLQLLVPFLEPLTAPLLAQIERCAAGEGGAVAGGRALVPTPLQEFSVDVLTHLAVCVRTAAFVPLFVAAMPRVMGVLARAAPFHSSSAVASGSVSEEEAAAIVRVQVGALECAAFMCRAVGAAVAAEHLPALVAMWGLLARPDIDSCSPLLVPLLAAIEPLAECFGPETRHLLGPALPLLAQWSAKDVGLRTLEDDESDAADDGDEAKKDEDEEEDDDDRDDSDVAMVCYDDNDYRCSSSVLLAKEAAVSALEELVDKMGPALAQQVNVAADALVPRLLEYYLDEVHTIARRTLPKLLRNYLLAVTQGSLPASDPVASPAAAQALLHRLWQAVTCVINPEALAPEAAAHLLRLPNGAERPSPTLSTRADMVEVLTQIVDCVEGTMLQQAWVAEAFAALQAAVTAAQEAADVSDDEEDSAGDKSMEADGSVDLEDDGSDASEDDEVEEEDEASDDGSETPEAARERLKTQVESCVAAFSRKYGDAVAALAQQVLAAQRPEQQREALVSVRNGVVA